MGKRRLRNGKSLALNAEGIVDPIRPLESFMSSIPKKYPRGSEEVKRSDLVALRQILEVVPIPKAALLARAVDGKRPLTAIEMHSEVGGILRQLRGVGRPTPQRSMLSPIGSQADIVRENASLHERIGRLEGRLGSLDQRAQPGDDRLGEDQGVFEVRLGRFRKAERRAFVVMPFASEFDDVWHGAIERACDEAKVVSLRVDEISLSKLITEDIKECIRISNIVIADITNGNPNVMFELGWTMCLEKKVVLIRNAKDETKVPFDVYGIRRIDYEDSWSGVEKLRKDVRDFLKSSFAEPPARKA